MPPAPPGAHPDLSGLSCRYEEIPASRGLVLSLVVAPGAAGAGRYVPRRDRGDRQHRGANPRRVAAGAGAAAALHLAAGRAPTSRRARRGGPASRSRQRKIKVLALDAVLYFLVMRFSITVGQLHSGEIHPRADRQFRFPEVRRCAPHGARLHAGAGRRDRAASRRLAPRRGIVRYGTHRQSAAMMTCFTPSPTRSNHVHFIDGAMGGYAMAASAMKAARVDLHGLLRVLLFAASE